MTLIFTDNAGVGVEIVLNREILIGKTKIPWVVAFHESFLVNPSNGCHEWFGPRYRNGFGKATYGDHEFEAHRLALSLEYRRDFAGVHIVHTCGNRSCVNTDHLLVQWANPNEAPEPPVTPTDPDKSLVRRLLQQGVPKKVLARMFRMAAYEFEHNDYAPWHHDFTRGVLRTASTGETLKDQVAHALTGLCAETGEVANLLRKNLYGGHPIDVDKIEDELGDVLFYFSWLAHLFSLDLEEIGKRNQEKLKKRFPERFSVEASMARVDVAESEAKDE